jgi:hypothetical protein
MKLLFKITSGTGNQLFQLAQALAVAKKNDRIILDLSNYNQDIKRKPMLHLILPFIDIEYVLEIRSRPRINIKERKEYKFSRMIRLPSFFAKYSGYFQNDLNTSKVAGEISKAIHNYVNHDEIKTCDCGLRHINMHFRRGDLVFETYLKDSIGALSDDYFFKIVKENELLKNGHLTVFSDSPKLAQLWISKLPKGKVTLFEDDSLDDFHLMVQLTNCDVLILSNSTFSYWAAKVSRDANLSVHAPSQWHRTLKASRQLNSAGWLIHESAWYD